MRYNACIENFLEQYAKLKLSVPRAALFNTKSENSEYTSYSINNRNVYICMGCEDNEDCYYGYWIYTNKDAADLSFTYDTQSAYECIDMRRCYGADFCQDCTDCRDMFLCFDCLGCSDCFGCAGLRRAKFQIFNKQYSREDYFKEVSALREKWKNPPGREEIFAQFEKFKEAAPHLYMRHLNTENCTGDYIYNCRNCQWCFDARECEDCTYCYNTFNLKNCSDMAFGKQGELLYECVSAYGVNFNYCYVCWGGANLDFCELCFNKRSSEFKID